MNKGWLLAALTLLTTLFTTYAQDIATVRNAAVGATVTLRGVSLNGSELNNIRYIQDATGAIAIYGSNVNTILRGDSVLATGTMTNYNNLVEVTPITASEVLANVALPTVQLITDVSTVSEPYEGELLRFEGGIFANSGDIFAGNTNYNVTFGAQTLQVRILNGNPLVGQIIPSGTVNLRGILSQYCTSPTSGCTSGYQLLLRDLADIESTSSISLTSPIGVSAITTTSFDIDWSTNIAGTSSYIKYGITPALELGTVPAGSNTTDHVVTVSGLTPATIYYVRAWSMNDADSAVTLERTFATQSLSTGDIRVYFNRFVDASYSTGTDAQYLNHLVADTLAAYINRATSSLDICIYNWDNSTNGRKIIQAVNAAHTRGVQVRVIQDGSTVNSAIDELLPGIHTFGTPQGSDYAIMHNKFVIIDAHASNPNLPIVWTGATNFSSEQLITDANNVIIFQDQSLARGYKMEFDEMWGDADQASAPNTFLSKFGQFKTDNTPHEYIIGGKRVESYFSPSDQTNAKILNTIATADDELYFCVFVATRSDLAYAIRDQITTNDLTAKGMIDDEQTSTIPYGILSPTMGSNIAFNQHSWILHHKYLLIDIANPASDPLVLTGSHNWSSAADQKNDENTVIVHDATVANQYYQEFMARWCERNGMSCSLGLDDAADPAQTLLVYPNPNTGNFSVLLTGNGEAAVLELLDITGKKVYSRTTSTQSGTQTIPVDIPGLEKGVYLLQVTLSGLTRMVHIVQQ